MKINDKRVKRMRKVSEIAAADCFLYGDRLFLKGADLTATGFFSGNQTDFVNDDIVEAVDAEVTYR